MATPAMARGEASEMRLLLSEREAGGGEAKWRSGEERGSAAAKSGGVGRDVAGRCAARRTRRRMAATRRARSGAGQVWARRTGEAQRGGRPS